MPPRPPDRPDDPVTYRIFNEIAIIDQLATAALRKVLAPPLNPSMFGVLNHCVRLGDGKTPSYLAEAFQITRPSMTAILEKLAKAGFVRVEQDAKDARTKRVWLTQSGRAARNEAVQATAGLIATIEQDLAQINQESLLAMLCELRAVLDRAR